MNKLISKINPGLIGLFLLATACGPSGQKQTNNMNNYEKGTFGYDSAFFANKNIRTIELKDSASNSKILIVPGYQGRVMTSTANGNEGTSFGWINYKLIESGKISNQFNPFGGEERIWLGPEGGPFSIYFPKGKEQTFENWVVPKEVDTVAFDVVSQNSESVSFKKDFTLTNYSGTALNIGIERSIKVLSRNEIEKALNVSLDSSLNCVGYQSENTLINKGSNSWNKQTGALSIWLLAMFNPSTEGVVFIPYKDKDQSGKIVNDDYFGKVPSDRLITKDGVIFFKTDGKLRSKIGVPPQRALPYCGSYDPKGHVLTLLWFSLPEKPAEYVNSKWGKQDNPFEGDAINAYNDGPVADGSIMGPFYEIESSSPAAFLQGGEKISHTQRIFHIMGDEARISAVTEKLFNLPISSIKQSFAK